ncbi:hypothetical protein L3Q82_021668 [Scortum barcoo]|uniref:Uncharacterized protein n=1 Tax=Scortum barcoo TaxID=214431 RepID=A0ACB8X504_9TELE|nr:hypothetical protein L3Q82_021668 [Scortum barcoo]
MAAPFVPVSYPVDWTGASRSWTKTGSPVYTSVSSISFEPSPPEGIDDSWSRPRGAMLDGSATPLHSEGSFGHCWVERPFTPTLLGYDILEERAKFTVYKILVTGRQGDSWVIFRRYADFLRLSDKLKELFPSFGLSLPPKCGSKTTMMRSF